MSTGTIQAVFSFLLKLTGCLKNLPNFRSEMTQNTIRGEDARLAEDLLRSMTTQETDKDDEIEAVKVDPGGPPGTCRGEKSDGTMTLIRHIETDTRLRGS
jgi:hypothetical protein